METQRRQSKEEEPSRAFLKRIQSLGPNFNSKVEKFKDSIKSLTDELSTWKKIENQVLADVAESIRNIDDLIERNDEYRTSQSDPQELERKKEKIIDDCIKQIQNHITMKNGTKKGIKDVNQALNQHSIGGRHQRRMQRIGYW